MFDQFQLHERLLKALDAQGITHPTQVQAETLPRAMAGQDLMVSAETGSGKTLAFLLPILHHCIEQPAPRSGTRALILTPTRELAEQVAASCEKLAAFTQMSALSVCGGENYQNQAAKIRKNPEVIVGTPGRIKEHLERGTIDFDDLEFLVLDEADRMLDMGFIRDIRKIIALIPPKRQNLMFSATFSKEIRKLANSICRNPVEIDVAPRNSTVEAIEQNLWFVEKPLKADLLCELIQETTEQVLVFSRTKHGANKLVKRLARDSISAVAIHGNRSQSQRTKALADFKANKVQVLVATDIAARGIDIELLALVINFDLPHVPEDYVHRIGRTGRAGASGVALSLVSNDEKKQLRAIERLIKREITVLGDYY